MLIWTESPGEELWSQLRYFSKASNAARLLTGDIKSSRTEKWNISLAENAGVEISSCIRQADEYFSAARTVSLSTRPLLLFYGALALSKAVIISSKKEICLHDLRYHGLSTRGSTAADQNRKEELIRYAQDSDLWNLEEEYGVVNQGVFPYLCEVAEDVALSKGDVITLKELFRVLPDMRDLFERHYGEIHNSLSVYTTKKDGKQNIGLYFNEKQHDVVENVFPELVNELEKDMLHTHHAGYPNVSIDEIEYGILRHGTVAQQFLVRPHSTGISSSPSVLFAAMFILGNLVRYKPSYWIQCIDDGSVGSLSIVESFCNQFERRFPNDVLDLIWSERVNFGASAYLG